MNSICPVCGTRLVGSEDVEPVPISEQPPESEEPPTIGGLWFCTEACRDEYKAEEDGE